MAFLFFLSSQIETLQQENSSLKKQCQKVKEQFQQQKVSHLLLAVVWQMDQQLCWKDDVKDMSQRADE